MHDEALAAALTRELAAAIEAGVGEPITATPGAPASGDGWIVTLTVAGTLNGQLQAWMSADGAVAVARQLLGMDEAPEPAVIADMLKELWGQAAGAVMAQGELGGLSVVSSLAEAAPGSGGRGWTLATAAGTALAQVTLGGALIAAPLTPAAAPGHAASGGGRGVAPGGTGSEPNLAVLLDIDLPLVVRFGRTDLTLKSLTELGPGSLVDMGRAPEDPVQILVGGQVVAQGEVVVVTGNYGVRITSLLSPAERLKALEA